MDPKDRMIVALDVDSPTRALVLAKLLAPVVGCFKFGLEFISSMIASVVLAESEEKAAANSRIIRELFQTLEDKIFWDGKFADIPNTVGKASGAVARMNVKMFNVHATCGIEAMRAAVANKGSSLVLAVTVLTSLSDTDSKHIFGEESKPKVAALAYDAMAAGCDGIVCSPQELNFLAGYECDLGNLLKVTPGIRSSDAPPDDQNRTMTPAEAIKAGATYLVIGRPIINYPMEKGGPVEGAKKIADEIASVL
ncbi:MAG TPA: orotidine-5'-phosphate decarboxylase [Candidatus Methylomirabilis sp.]|nr:orotidine-5'-phosphate decarboxylase [Candidatus Methylomirabilis sp.]